MNAKFTHINATADYIGPGAIEVPIYQTEILDLVRRRGVFGQRIKQVPATGHPSRYFEETAIPAAAAASAFVNPRAIVPASCSRPALRTAFPEGAGRTDQLQPVRSRTGQAAEPVCVSAGQGSHRHRRWCSAHARHRTVERHRHQPQLADHCAVLRRGRADCCGRQHNHDSARVESIVDGLKSTIAQMLANSSFGVRPTAIYANPVLLDLIDREMKTEFNVVLNTKNIEGGLTVKTLSTQAGDIPLIPEWTLPYTGVPGSGSAVLPAYIVTEDLIEYHWLGEPNPRVFQLGMQGSLASQYAVVKFGAVVVKGASYAHYQVLVDR